MTANTLSLSQRRELASRSSDDLEVTLWWDPRINASRSRCGTGSVTPTSSSAADRDRALDVFYHPFSYASRHRLDDAMAGAL